MYVTIEKSRVNGNIRIKADDCPAIRYIGHTERSALREFRRVYGLERKHLTKIYI